MACGAAYKEDVEYGKEISKRAKEVIELFINDLTGANSWELEKYAFANKVEYEILTKLYEVLLIEAQNMNVDSGFRYLEKKREPKDRFYMPRRKQLLKIGLIDALQGMIDDKYDILCISLIPGAGKTTIEKFFNALIIGWFPKDFNLFYSHSGDITRMYYDGMLDIVTNADEYTWGEIFPDLSVTRTDAKMEQFNVGKYKPFPSVQCTSVGSKNAGKVRASKFLLVDDMIGGIEEALNPMVLDKLWNKYAVDARQRKIQDTNGRNCKEIHIATRWSVNDVIGRIQRMYDGNPRVKVIAVPDIDPQTGESNFDYEYSGFTVDFFADQQLLMDDISYKCLYKQEPIEREGLLFPEDKIRRYLNLPHGEADAVTAQCDTKGKGTDYFVMPVLQKYDNEWYCVDCVCDNTADYEMQYENASNVLVNNAVQDCEFESNAGGDRVALEVNKRVESKGWICNITSRPTETNKEARIFQCSSWILQNVIFKDPSLYSPKEPYGIMMSLLKQYSVSGKKQLDDVPDVFSNFALRIQRKDRVKQTMIIQSPI
jgi:phage terminase large subunit-like protein